MRDEPFIIVNMRDEPALLLNARPLHLLILNLIWSCQNKAHTSHSNSQASYQKNKIMERKKACGYEFMSGLPVTQYGVGLWCRRHPRSTIVQVWYPWFITAWFVAPSASLIKKMSMLSVPWVQAKLHAPVESRVRYYDRKSGIPEDWAVQHPVRNR